MTKELDISKCDRCRCTLFHSMAEVRALQRRYDAAQAEAALAFADLSEIAGRLGHALACLAAVIDGVPVVKCSQMTKKKRATKKP